MPQWTLLGLGLIGALAYVGCVAGGKHRSECLGVLAGFIPAGVAAVYVVGVAISWAAPARDATDEALVGWSPDRWGRLQDSLPLMIPLEEAIGACVAAVVLLAFCLLFRAVGKWLYPERAPKSGGGSLTAI